jgi:hypothetical protein
MQLAKAAMRAASQFLRIFSTFAMFFARSLAEGCAPQTISGISVLAWHNALLSLPSSKNPDSSFGLSCT